MRNYCTMAIIVLMLVAVPALLVAEKIYSISDNSFETEEQRILLTEDQFSEAIEFVFRSSPSLRGRLEILSSRKSEIEIIYHKVLFAKSREQADSFAQMISLEYEVSRNSFILSANAPRDAAWSRSANLSGKIDCEIYIPEDLSLSMEVEGYYLNIKGPFPEADLGGDYCEEIRVSKIELGLKIDAGNSAIILRDINGPTLIIGEGANISARNVNSGLGIASFENKRGEISIIGFEGDELRCIAEDGKINLEKISLLDGARAYVKNSGINSDVYIDIESISNSKLEIFNRAADIDILVPRDISAEFEISTDPDEGEIEINGVPLITEKATWGMILAHTYIHDSRILVDTRGAGKVTISKKGF